MDRLFYQRQWEQWRKAKENENVYTVTWETEGGEQHKATNIPLIQMVVDVLEKLDDAERESVRVTDNNPEGDVTEYCFELLIERYAPDANTNLLRSQE